MPTTLKISFKILVVLALIPSNLCWDPEDYEIFDLVEEVKNENFYKMMNIEQNATGQQIKRAFRNLSVILHPDKNDAEDANVVFRNLVAVYDVLKDAGKREKYDKVLKNGLPNWRSAAYYYRHVRKMGLTEMFIILFVIITICQYLVSWAVYVERKYTAKEVFGSKLKKLQKKNKNVVDIDTILNEIPTPSIKDTLPFQIPQFVWWIFTGAPKELKNTIQMYSNIKKEEEAERLRLQEEEEEQKKYDEERLKEREEAKALRKRNKKFVAPVKTAEELREYTQSILKDKELDAINHKKQLISGIWTDDDLIELVRLVKKYPGGTTDRWDVIADAMNRCVSEVTVMAAKMKDTPFKVPTESVAETIIMEANKKVKTKKSDPILIPENTWSQQQQQSLENAIQRHPKGIAGDRWQKIANNVPGKTKEECVLRYKYLVDLVKKQKNTPSPVDHPADDDSLNMADEEKVAGVVDEVESSVQDVAEGKAAASGGRKTKNKRKEMKKNLDFYNNSDESDVSQ